LSAGTSQEARQRLPPAAGISPFAEARTGAG